MSNDSLEKLSSLNQSFNTIWHLCCLKCKSRWKGGKMDGFAFCQIARLNKKGQREQSRIINWVHCAVYMMYYSEPQATHNGCHKLISRRWWNYEAMALIFFKLLLKDSLTARGRKGVQKKKKKAEENFQNKLKRKEKYKR